MNDARYLLLVAVIAIVAITGMVIMTVSNASISGDATKRIQQFPGTPTLVVPADQANTSLTPRFHWTLGGRTDFVVLYIDVEPGFSTPLVLDAQLAKKLKAYVVQNGTLQPGTTYYWRVVAYNNAGATNSETRTFTTAPQ